MYGLPATPSPLAWKILALTGLATICVGSAQGFSIDASKFLITSILCGGLLAAATLAHTKFKSAAAAETCMLFCFWCAMWAILLPASYIAASFNQPLIDPILMRMDQALGLDWPAFQAWTDSTPWAATLFKNVYEHSVVQVVVVIFTLGATRNIDRLNVYVTGLLLATLATLVISAIFPATGAYPAYNVRPLPYGPIASQIEVWQSMTDFLALRNGTLRQLTGSYDGIIALPSFHTALAVTAAWAAWPIRYIGRANAVLSVLVLVTTLPIGSHHLMDVFAGIAVSAAALWLASKAERSSSESKPSLQPAPGLAQASLS